MKNETNLRVAKEVNGIQGYGMCFCLSEFQNMEITSLICELNYKCERVDTFSCKFLTSSFLFPQNVSSARGLSNVEGPKDDLWSHSHVSAVAIAQGGVGDGEQ